MSLDGGGISNSPGAQDTASAMEEDYCLHGRERFHHQWATTGVFHPGALRLYGITGEPILLRAIKQTRMLCATFGTCFLGRFPTCVSQTAADAVKSDEETLATAENANQSTDNQLPFSTLLLGPLQSPEFRANPQREVEAWRREVANTWDVLQMPSEWCHAMNGVVTEMNWTTQAQRQRIKEQLELGSFMGLSAVQVPLPFYTRELPWAAGGDEDIDDSERSEFGVKGSVDTELAMTLSPDEDGQRNTRLACLAADILLAFIQQSPNVKVWVRCDGCNPAHRYQMQRLRQAVLYGYTRQTRPGNKLVYKVNAPRGVTSTRSVSNNDHDNKNGSSDGSIGGGAGGHDQRVHTEAVSALMAMLYFSSWHPQMLLPSEWLGEQVVCFECPPAPLLFACMAPHGVAPQQHPHYLAGAAVATAEGRGDAFAPVNSVVTEEEGEGSHLLANGNDLHTPPPPPRPHTTGPCYYKNASRRSSPANLLHVGENEADLSAVLSTTNYSLGDWAEELATEGQRSPGAAAAAGVGMNANTTTINSARMGVLSTPFPNEQSDTDAAATDAQTPEVIHRRYTYVMPDDLHPLSTARWAGGYPPFVSVLTFLVEMMRRRAFPLFDRSFFDQYPLLNYLYFKAVEEPTRDVFAPFEGQLQLPLQPLVHHLSSGIYEVFERDARKYRQYREAIFSYVKDWYNAGSERQHAAQNAEFFAQHGVMRKVPMPFVEERVLHLVLLGCGRGPLIDECLNAVSALGVRLRLFAIEKNRPAAAFTRMRWANDPEWSQLAYTFGHTLDVIVADGRHLARDAAAGTSNGETVRLPPDFGLCDVIVSELLGSFGDNELSPECLEAFHAQLLEIQQQRGLRRNPHLTCIPRSYTAYIAPLMSASLEAAVADAAVKGLTVAPPTCFDHHAALDHSLLVTNLSRGIILAPPQACWTFTHDFRDEQQESQKAPCESRDSALPSSEREKPNRLAKTATALTPTTTTASTDRIAHLVFTVPACGRCSGLAGFFSCVLYASSTSPPVTISTAPEQRTEDMYSWFPCTFTLDPTQRRELHEVAAASASQSGAVTIHVDMARKTSVSRRQVWYEWAVRYCGAGEAPPRDDASSAAPVVVHNRDGWASSMLL